MYAHGLVQETVGDQTAPYRLIERVEGDITLWGFATHAELIAATDEMAEQWWRLDPESHGAMRSQAGLSTFTISDLRRHIR